MKTLVLAAVFAALSSATLAGATRDARPQADTEADQTAAHVIADTSRLGSASLSSLNGTPWGPQNPSAESDFGGSTPDIDTGTLLVILGVLAVALARPVSRALRRQEQHRRATALASTLGHPPRA